jgi:hypothetical protein
MRDIKFRAWDKKGVFRNIKTAKFEPHMIPDVGISITPRPFGEQPEWFTDKIKPHIPVNDGKFILMQFTGAKDINGTEIYECDIVIDSDNCMGVVVWDDEGYRWYVIDEVDNLGLDEWEFVGIEVISNIYENPELLGEE